MVCLFSLCILDLNLSEKIIKNKIFFIPRKVVRDLYKNKFIVFLTCLLLAIHQYKIRPGLNYRGADHFHHSA